MKNKYIQFCLVFLSICYVSDAQDSILTRYVQTGLENNLALKQKLDDYEKSLQSLKAAAGYFYPDISIDARYTVAQGGRTIDFPVGDLLNPVYSTLNQLLQADQFPMLENMEFQFYRPHEQETRLTLVQPVIYPSIFYNHQIEKVKTKVVRTDIEIYKRELVFEIKSAFYNYLKAEKIKILIDETLVLLNENLRVSKRLFNNDMVTIDVVLRSEAELQKLHVRLVEAEKAINLSKAYFNFLINRSLNDPIEVIDEDISHEITLFADIEKQVEKGLNSREEIAQLDLYKSINNSYIRLARSSNYPNIFLSANYGIQGENYSFTRNDDFILASVVFQWNLFQGFRNNANVAQAKISLHQIDLKNEEVKKQIELQIINGYYDLMSASKQVVAAESLAEASSKAFNVINSKYENGQAQLIEYLDARNSMTIAKENLIIAQYDFKIMESSFERIVADNTITE